MGKRHNTLSDDIFRNSKYINALERELGIDDFRKEYKEQYDIMLDVYKTLITINNILFADSNKSIYDKNIEIDEALTECIGTQNYKEYHKKEDEKEEGKKTPIRSYKYSTRTLKGLVDSNTRLLYEKFKGWHETLYNDKTIINVKSEIEKEMTRLENIGFDNVVKKDIEYKKNKDSKYKIFISKLGKFYQNNEEELDKVKNTFQEEYGCELDEEQMIFISHLFDVICYGNNGITLILQPELEYIDIDERSTPQEVYNAYFSALNIKYNYMRVEATTFLWRALNLYQELKLNMPFGMFISVFDYFNFIDIVSDIEEDVITNNNYIDKIISDLKKACELLKESNQKDFKEYQEKQKQALEIIQKIIDRNITKFERVS